MALKESANEAGSATDYAPFLAERSALKRLDARRVAQEGNPPRRAIGGGNRPSATGRLQAIMATATPLKPVKLSEITKRVVTFSGRLETRTSCPGHHGPVRAGRNDRAADGRRLHRHHRRARRRQERIAGPDRQAHRPFSHVLSCHNEMSEEQNGTRFVAGESGMSVRQIREGAYDFTGADDVKAAQAGSKSCNITSTPTPA
jgi:hypothetical protein